MQKTLAYYKESKLRRRTNPIILTLVCFSLLTALLTVVYLSNWQFWLNLSLTVFVATLSLIHQDKK